MNLATMLIAGAIALSGCTTSGTGTASGEGTSWLRSNPTSLVLAVNDPTIAVEEFLEETQENTGLSIEVVTVENQWVADTVIAGEASPHNEDTGVAVYMGLLPGVTGSALNADQYGEEDVCVLADRSWYSANKMPLPRGRTSLSDEELFGVLSASDPQISSLAAASMPIWSKRLQSVVDSDAQSAYEGAPSAVPGKIGSSLEPLRHTNNLGTETRYAVVSGTCVAEPVYLVDLSGEYADKDAADLIRYLLSEGGQELVARYSLAYPAATHPEEAQSGGAPSNGEDQVEMPARPDAVAAFSPEEVTAATALWLKVFR